jgi:hypothetical protein
MSDVVLRMSLSHASTLVVAARAIADTAGEIGLRGVARTEVEALLSEALTTVIADSFDGSDVIDVDVTVSHEPGRVDILLQQRGAPSTYVSGELPVRLETLLSLGYADSMDFVSNGVHGSELRIHRAVRTGSLTDDPEFVSQTQEADESTAEIDDVVIRPITVDDVVGVARLYFRVYGYTKIGSPWIYEPDVFRHRLEQRLHEAVVAVTPSGRIVGHLGLLRSSPDSPSASGGPLAVDPAFRNRGLADRLGGDFLPVMLSLDLRGIYAEAVTAHPASQKTALKMGGHEVGLVLGRQPADLDFLGFDGPRGFRRAVMVLYTSFGTSPESTVHVPARYRDMVAQIYDRLRLPRTLDAGTGRPPADLPSTSRLSTQLTSATRFAQITVEEYGADFVEALQRLVHRFARENFEVVTVHLPLSSPLTSYFGAGLGELGLSFNAIFPEQENGDELVLGLCLTEQDPDTMAVASDFGAVLRDYVLADRERLMSTSLSRARSRASMARILDAL